MDPFHKLVAEAFEIVRSPVGCGNSQCTLRICAERRGKDEGSLPAVLDANQGAIEAISAARDALVSGTTETIHEHARIVIAAAAAGAAAEADASVGGEERGEEHNMEPGLDTARASSPAVGDSGDDDNSNSNNDDDDVEMSTGDASAAVSNAVGTVDDEAAAVDTATAAEGKEDGGKKEGGDAEMDGTPHRDATMDTDDGAATAVTATAAAVAPPTPASTDFSLEAPPSEDPGAMLLSLAEKIASSSSAGESAGADARPEGAGSEESRRELLVTLGREFSELQQVDSLFFSREASRPVRYKNRDYEGHGVDIDAASRFFTLVRQCGDVHDAYMNLASPRITDLRLSLPTLQGGAAAGVSAAQGCSVALRAVAMIMILDEQLQDPDTHSTLFARILKLLASLPGADRGGIGFATAASAAGAGGSTAASDSVLGALGIDLGAGTGPGIGAGTGAGSGAGSGMSGERADDGPGGSQEVRGRGGLAGCDAYTVEAWWTTLGPERFRDFLGAVQQFVTYRILATMVLDPPTYHAMAVLSMLNRVNEETRWVDYSAFHNDAVNEYVAIDSDYEVWRRGGPSARQTFCHYPFVLNPASKSELLEADARYQMAIESRQAMIGSLFSGTRPSTRLVLHVRRAHVVRDALTQLTARTQATSELKKPLFVKFRGEEGQDEGGVQKEFFQLIIKDLFDPSYGMFVDLEARGCYWFSHSELGSAVEFELIGTVLGLAIYNSVILQVKFPVVVYRKLLGQSVTLRDFAEINPDAARGLQQLLDYDPAEVEAVFARNFEATYEVFGEKRTVPLKDGGSEIPVTGENRAEYVDAYVDFFLSKLIEKHFDAFRRGFDRVCGGFAIRLFRPEELELLISGSASYDFGALEASTGYDGGYNKDTPVIRWFWEVVHEFSDEQRRQLLAFATGSDRVPIRGLAALNFRILRASPDSENLPTASTCFNYLMIPEYSSKEKLEKLLSIAIRHSEGFGIL